MKDTSCCRQRWRHTVKRARRDGHLNTSSSSAAAWRQRQPTTDTRDITTVWRPALWLLTPVRPNTDTGDTASSRRWQDPPDTRTITSRRLNWKTLNGWPTIRDQGPSSRGTRGGCRIQQYDGENSNGKRESNASNVTWKQNMMTAHERRQQPTKLCCSSHSYRTTMRLPQTEMR